MGHWGSTSSSVLSVCVSVWSGHQSFTCVYFLCFGKLTIQGFRTRRQRFSHHSKSAVSSVCGSHPPATSPDYDCHPVDSISPSSRLFAAQRRFAATRQSLLSLLANSHPPAIQYPLMIHSHQAPRLLHQSRPSRSHLFPFLYLLPCLTVRNLSSPMSGVVAFAVLYEQL